MSRQQRQAIKELAGYYHRDQDFPIHDAVRLAAEQEQPYAGAFWAATTDR